MSRRDFNKWLLGAGAVVVTGCSQRRKPGRKPPPLPPPPEAQIIARIQPLIITSGQQHRWTADKLAAAIDTASTAFAGAGIRLDFYEPLYVENPELYEIDAGSQMLPPEWVTICKEAETHSRHAGELLVHLVNRIPYCGCAGMANYPSNVPGPFQHGVAVVPTYPGTLAHELGHAFGLVHAWDADPPTCADSKDCQTQSCRDDLRGYCVYLRHKFPKQAAEIMRAWAAAPPRSQVCDVLVPQPKRVLKRTDNVKPVTCEE
jgi:hypothetical protein